MAGRCTLVQSVLASVHTYAMQMVWLSFSTSNVINKINCNFLRGPIQKKQKLHIIKWDTVMKKNKDKGLNIRDARLASIALLAKVGGRLALGVDSLWATTKSKYLRNQNIF